MNEILVSKGHKFKICGKKRGNVAYLTQDAEVGITLCVCVLLWCVCVLPFL